MCVNFIYDLNGAKGPNTVSKDIGFITVLYPTDSVVVAPMPLNKDLDEKKTQPQLSGVCESAFENSRMPNRDELAAMFYNRNLLNMQTSGAYRSGTIISKITAWGHNFNAGYRIIVDSNYQGVVRCIKR